MVEPTHFFFNTETAADNEFMNEVKDEHGALSETAIKEHQDFQKALRDADIEVLKFDQQAPDLPDSLFPNNWVSIHRYPGIIDERLVVVYPMKCPTRQREVNYKIVNELVGEKGKLIDLTSFNEAGKALEGTGVLIFDPINAKVYANISQRCEKDVLDHFMEKFNEVSSVPFKAVTFTSTTKTGTPIYHTNVMFAILSDHAVVCLESIADEDERENLRNELTNPDLNVAPKKIIDISLDEVNKM